MSNSEYFTTLTTIPDQRIDLAEAALHIAKDEYPYLDIDFYLQLLANWGEQLARSRSKSELACIEELNAFLYSRMNFEGNLENYYDPKNSFLNDVMDRKKGIPITLSIIYLDLAWRMGLKANGIGFPGHFLVGVETETNPFYVDAFHKGKLMTVEDCASLLEKISGGTIEFQEGFLSPLDKKKILSRMLRNLKGIYLERGNEDKLITVMDRIIILNQDDAQEFRDRGIIHYKRQAFLFALKDFEKYLSLSPDGKDSEMVRQYLEILHDYSNRMN
jgi:regulator of sirC expression with transglutaminase-like and TPR domain